MDLLPTMVTQLFPTNFNETPTPAVTVAIILGIWKHFRTELPTNSPLPCLCTIVIIIIIIFIMTLPKKTIAEQIGGKELKWSLWMLLQLWFSSLCMYV